MSNRGRPALYIGKTCRAEGCENPATIKGFCRNHWAQNYYLSKIGRPKRILNRDLICAAVVNSIKCEKKAHTRGLCKYHYGRLIKYGKLELNNPTRVIIRKLTPEQIEDIKQSWAKHEEARRIIKENNGPAIVERYGITRQAVDHIIKGKMYKDVRSNP